MEVIPKIRNERLAQGVRVLEELPPEKKVHMNNWRECRMVACAGGWMAVDPWFNRQGFCASKGGSPVYLGDFGFDALRAFFGIDSQVSSHLFAAEEYSKIQRTRRVSVIARFKRYIREHPAE